ncbi:MAG: hypothetical protein NTV34_01475 [Proteobacteria bacterium]|nr:hypothetical protein [Pseudomonadota bacterium]
MVYALMLEITNDFVTVLDGRHSSKLALTLDTLGHVGLADQLLRMARQLGLTA